MVSTQAQRQRLAERPLASLRPLTSRRGRKRASAGSKRSQRSSSKASAKSFGCSLRAAFKPQFGASSITTLVATARKRCHCVQFVDFQTWLQPTLLAAARAEEEPEEVKGCWGRCCRLAALILASQARPAVADVAVLPFQGQATQD